MTLPIDAHITFLKVADLDRSSAFYGDGLGLTMVLDQGGCRIYALTDSAFLGVCERPGEKASNVMVTFTVLLTSPSRPFTTSTYISRVMVPDRGYFTS